MSDVGKLLEALFKSGGKWRPQRDLNSRRRRERVTTNPINTNTAVGISPENNGLWVGGFMSPALFLLEKCWKKITTIEPRSLIENGLFLCWINAGSPSKKNLL